MEIQHEQERASLPAGTTAFITELLSSMSHELRSPLASIKAYATTLLRRDQRLYVPSGRSSSSPSIRPVIAWRS